MVKEAYCSFEVAKLLKEKGFNEPCRAVYEEGILRANTLCDYLNSELSSYICAPTHQMAMAWLKEKYNIYISIQPDFPSDRDFKLCWCWSANILYKNCISIKKHQCYIETYEEATEAALKYTLKKIYSHGSKQNTKGDLCR